MLTYNLGRQPARLVRIILLAFAVWSVFTAKHDPGTSGRHLVVAMTLAASVVAYLSWTAWPGRERGLSLDLFVLAGAGGVLTGAAPDSAASAFVFVAVVAAGYRVPASSALVVVAVGALALAVATLAYDNSALGLLAYSLGFGVAVLGGSNSRQSIERADQAELLLAQTQRSHEEQLRAARLEESTRIAREIHDVLAHALAGLTIQLEATSSLLTQGADRDVVLARVQRAHELARDGLRETRRAVGALRGEPVSAVAGIEALVADYRAAAQAPVQLLIDGDGERLRGASGHVALRVVQEALTNARKHAPGAEVSVAVHAGGPDGAPDQELVVIVEDRVEGDGDGDGDGDARRVPDNAAADLARSGGGYGVLGMRERAASVGGKLSAGPTADGWRVELRLPGAGR